MSELPTVQTYREFGEERTLPVRTLPQQRLVRVIAHEQRGQGIALTFASQSQRGRRHHVCVDPDGLVGACDCIAASYGRPCHHRQHADEIAAAVMRMLSDLACIEASRVEPHSAAETAYREGCHRRLREQRFHLECLGYELVELRGVLGEVA